MSILTLTLPEDLDIEALAQWYASNFAAIKATRSFLYLTSKRLTDWVKEGGPVRTPAGLLEIVPDGYTWDSEMIKVVMPSLLTGGKVTFSSDLIEKIERILSLALEEVPDVNYEVSWTVDKYAASNVIKQGGEAGEKVLEARKPNGSLGVRE